MLSLICREKFSLVNMLICPKSIHTVTQTAKLIFLMCFLMCVPSKISKHHSKCIYLRSIIVTLKAKFRAELAVYLTNSRRRRRRGLQKQLENNFISIQKFTWVCLYQRSPYLHPALQGGLWGSVSFRNLSDLVIGGSLRPVLHPVPFTIKLHLWHMRLFQPLLISEQYTRNVTKHSVPGAYERR